MQLLAFRGLRWRPTGRVQTCFSKTFVHTLTPTHTYIRTQSPTATCFIPFHPHIKRGRGAVAVGSDRDPRTGTSAVRPAITGGTCMEQMSPASPTAGKAGEQKRRLDMSLTDPNTQLPHTVDRQYGSMSGCKTLHLTFTIRSQLGVHLAVNHWLRGSFIFCTIFF